MNKMGMVLAALVVLAGAATSWAQDAEESEPIAAPAVAEPARCDTGCCANQGSCHSRCGSRPAGNCDRAAWQFTCKARSPRRTGCDTGCGKECSLSALRDWLCFRRETVCCPKGPARRLPPLYTFFPCDDCGDDCGIGCANGFGIGRANENCCNK